MGSPLRANKSGLMPLRSHLDHDAEAILAMNAKIGLALAQHTVKKLEIMEAPDWAFERMLERCFFALPEFASGLIIQAQAKDFFALALRCGMHAKSDMREQIVLIARRFRDYKLLKETVKTLLKRNLTKFELLEAAKLIHESNREFTETASLMLIDAFKIYGVEFRQEIKEIIAKKHAKYEFSEEEGVAAV